MEAKSYKFEERMKERLAKKSMAESINQYLEMLINSQPFFNYTAPLNQDAVKYLEEYIDWNLVSRFVKMTDEFLEENIGRLYFEYLSYNKTLPGKFILNHLDKLNLEHLYYVEAIDIHFVCEHGSKVAIQNCLRIEDKRRKGIM